MSVLSNFLTDDSESGVSQIRAGKPRVSPLPGLADYPVHDFPPLLRWAMICCPSGTSTKMR
jgi:hypothetical protein